LISSGRASYRKKKKEIKKTIGYTFQGKKMEKRESRKRLSPKVTDLTCKLDPIDASDDGKVLMS
jgi:hypothetical protein